MSLSVCFELYFALYCAFVCLLLLCLLALLVGCCCLLLLFVHSIFVMSAHRLPVEVAASTHADISPSGPQTTKIS